MRPASDLPDFRLESFFGAHEFAAKHHLTASDIESRSIRQLLSMTGSTVDVLLDLSLGYTPSRGTDEFRKAVADSYHGLQAEDVLGFAGAGEALFWTMQVFTEPGDHVIVTVPNYQSIESIPLTSGLDVSGLPLWRGEGENLEWTLDLDRFESMIKANTRLVSVNFPNNPTGFVPDRETWTAFLAICAERGIRVISDEVYRGVELDARHTLPAAVELSPSAISISVMSKAYGLPGLRVGWVATQDHEALRRLERAKHYTSICNAAPSETLATIALQHGEKILESNRELIRANDDLAAAFFHSRGDLFDYSTPRGGCVTFPRYKGADGADEFCRRVLDEADVMLLPSSIYASDLASVPPDHFRIGIGRRAVPAALDALATYLDAL